MDQNFPELAGLILNCKPDDLKGVTRRADGSLAVIAPNGMKFIFSPVELENARDSFGLPSLQADPPSFPSDCSRAEPVDSPLAELVESPSAEPVEAALDKLGQRDIPGQHKRIKPMGQQGSGKSQRVGSRQ
jgi:hypothetical protein